jgi:hypothetical protein
VVGYVLRAMDATQAEKLLFINQTTLILLAPALYAASIYMILKRIFVLLEAESYSLVSVRWLTRFFVGCDILSFLTQGAGLLSLNKCFSVNRTFTNASSIAGGAMSASTSTTGKPGNKELGKWLIVVGLCLQLAAFSFFIVVIGIFHYRVRRQPTTKSRTIVVPWQRYLVVLYGASTIVVIRSVFRLIEYIQGRDGYLMGHEVYAYVFDAAMMLILSIEFNIFHPSQIVSRRTKTKTMEEVSE